MIAIALGVMIGVLAGIPLALVVMQWEKSKAK